MALKLLSRALTGAIVLCCFITRAEPATHYFANPIFEQADPWITQDHGHYLACFTEGNRAISVHISDRMTALGVKHIVWRAPDFGPASQEVWAPELHKLDGRWYIYFAADDGVNEHHHAWVLQSAGDDPLGPYTLHGPLYTGDDPSLASNNRWAIDLTVLETGHRRYAIWSGWQGDRDIQHLFIAPMKDPLTMAAPRVCLCANDDFLWERVDESPEGRGLNEAPEVLQHHGRTFVTFSCSGSWQPSYKIGLMELKPGSDPLQPANWHKFPTPAFQATAATWGVGHNSFLTSPDGTQDWLIYHAKMDRENGWRRAVFAQPFTWKKEGVPEFGRPVAAAQLLPLPSGEIVPQVSGAHIFRFDKTENLNGWLYFGHHQLERIENGQLHLGDPEGKTVNGFRSGEKVVVDGGLWTNFTASVTMHFLDHQGQAGLLFRVNDPFLGYNGQSGYFAGVSPSRRKIILRSFDGKSWRELGSTPLNRPSDPCRLRVVARNGDIEVDSSGSKLKVHDLQFAAGSVGLRVVDSDTAFSDLDVTPEPASPTVIYRASLPR